MTKKTCIGVMGGGAWGTAIAQLLCRPGHDIQLWCRSDAQAESINAHNENRRYLPGIVLDPALTATSNINALVDAKVLFSVTPAQNTRGVLEQLSGKIKPNTPVILCSKGIELSSRMFMTDVLKDVLPEGVPIVLSGPSFAADVARGLPTAVTLAASDESLGARMIALISTPTFRPYLSNDVLGAEIGGAVKNVLAIACGIALGKGLGRSAHAALISRGAAEMTRLAVALGAKPETLSGLSGLGDLVLTCSSEASRNMSCGLALGRGQSLDAVLNERIAVTEGVATAPVLVALATQAGIEMPISASVADVIANRISVGDAIQNLLLRPNTVEAAHP